MSKIPGPKTWYLIGIGAIALIADGTRRLIKRRRQAEMTRSTPVEMGHAIPIIEFTPPVVEQASVKPAAARADDLTAIKGIGPTFAKRLKEAGITTFAAVAAATPEHLRKVTNASAIAKPEEWIAQARSM